MITPGDLRYSFFCNSGTEANEGALKFAKLHAQAQEAGPQASGSSLHRRLPRKSWLA